MKHSKAPSKGVLKPSTRRPSSTAQSKDDRNRETALYHARLIKNQKDMELQILASIEALLEYPLDSKADPTHPSGSDAAFFKDSLRPFRTKDYDDLIEERNIDKKCGYALCPRPCRNQDISSKFRILPRNGEPISVESRKMQKWCSKSCARQAMYVKVQLSEEPAWVRPANGDWHLELLSEVSPTKALEDQLDRLKLDQNQDIDVILPSLESLSLERGENARPDGNTLVDVNIWDRMITDPSVTAPQLKIGHVDSIEGYTPRGLEKADSENENDMLPTASRTRWR